jgi:hypothetical protein
MQFIFDHPCNLSEQERYTVIDWFLNRSESVTVTFTKADGTVRVMPCTVGINQTPTSANTTPIYHSMLVWSLDKNEWRQFKTMNVLSVSTND